MELLELDNSDLKHFTSVETNNSLTNYMYIPLISHKEMVDFKLLLLYSNT